jgi:peroxiredoxin
MEAPAINEPLPVGTPASPFALRDPSGELVRLEDLRGRPVVIVCRSPATRPPSAGARVGAAAAPR